MVYATYRFVSIDTVTVKMIFNVFYSFLERRVVKEKDTNQSLEMSHQGKFASCCTILF